VEELIPLPKMLAQLRSDLFAARAEGEDKTLRFLVEDIELELQMATTQEKEGGIGIKFWVLNADAKGKDSAVATQKLKLRLKAVQEVVNPDTGEHSTVPAKIGGKLPG
jgi:hypothetical protein